MSKTTSSRKEEEEEGIHAMFFYCLTDFLFLFNSRFIFWGRREVVIDRMVSFLGSEQMKMHARMYYIASH